MRAIIAAVVLSGGLVFGLPVDAQDLPLLRLVDQVEERPERAQQRGQAGQDQRRDPARGLGPQRRVVFTVRPPAQLAQRLDPVERVGAVAGLDRRAEHGAQQVDLLAQGPRDAGPGGGDVDAVPALHADEITADPQSYATSDPIARRPHPD
jgi:hypothetical protein